jgi:hypothetical protein
MAGNQAPIYSRVASIGFANTVANNSIGSTSGTGIIATTDYSGTVANTVVIFTADATNGGYVQRIRLKATGSTTTAAVARFYINNGGVITSNVNNSLYGEVSLPIVTASTTAATAEVDYPINVPLPPGYRILCGISSSAVLGAGWIPTVIAGAY